MRAAALVAFGLTLAAATLPGLLPTAFAQLPSLPDLLDNEITRRVEDSVVGQVADQVAGQIANKVEQSVASVVDSQVGQAVTRTVDSALDGVVSNAIDPLANKVIDPLTNKVIDPLLSPLGIQIGDTVEKLFGKLAPILAPPRDVVVEDNWRAAQNEWVALIQPNQLPALQVPALRVMQVTPLDATGLVMVRVVVSDQDNTAVRAQALLRSLGASAADRNHIYTANGGPEPDRREPDRPEPDEPKLDRIAPDEPAPAPAPAPGAIRARVGLIDTALLLKHAALKKADIVTRDFADGKGARPTAHGTAIASLLVGAEKNHEGLLPKGQLVAASAFYQADPKGPSRGATGATTTSLIASLDWMAQQKVGIINMSLAGPPNEVLGAMIQRLYARGILVVAAVGNDGPASRPLYPAAFEPVVAVTAVDRSSKIYRWANQGPQVDLAAWGVSSRVARDKGGYEEESGTSYAAPIVSAALAQAIANGAASSSAALKAIIAAAEDLGTRGRDNTYGYGLVKP